MKIGKIILIIVLIIVIYNSYWLIEKSGTVVSDLETDGFLKFGNIQKGQVLAYLPEGYKFLNYQYEINGCSISTFHRDVTSSQYIFKTKYPVYTYLVYHNKGPQLSVCRGSHKSVPFLYSLPETINGNEGDSYIFNCDLVHAGAINTFGDKRKVQQYKIAHISDMDKLITLHNVFKSKKGNCDISCGYEIFCRKVSLIFCFIINHLFTPYLQSKKKSLINDILVRIYGRSFYSI